MRIIQPNLIIEGINLTEKNLDQVGVEDSIEGEVMDTEVDLKATEEGLKGAEVDLKGEGEGVEVDSTGVGVMEEEEGLIITEVALMVIVEELIKGEGAEGEA